MVLRKKSGADEHREANRHETEFRVQARRNRLLGLWLAERFGLAGEDAAAYARDVVAADLDEPGHDDVVRKVMADVEQRKIDLTQAQLLAEMERLLSVARTQIEHEAPG